jgi:SAM-dependent methyltransferase
MSPVSLFELGLYSSKWIKDFYDQAGVWWGADPQAPSVHISRVETIERLCGAGSKTILDLGTGPGATAAALAEAGHRVTAVELSPARADYARKLARISRKGSLVVLEDDFYTVELKERFDVVCCWETFGLGTDADQRRLLKRMADDWLKPEGRVLMDVYSPFRPARDAGTERRLPLLVGVPGSVEMINRCQFDPFHSRWIDEWIPVSEPQNALAQTVRCYSPSDFLLLLEGTRLIMEHIEVEGRILHIEVNKVTISNLLMDAWCYLVELSASNK